MKFIYADSLDFVDPGYDFENDQHAPGREPYWGDQYPHEILGHAPYDGILVSRAIVGDHRLSGKYSESQAMRFRLVGARQFLRFTGSDLDERLLFGDCGAFSYVNQEEPPYSPEETAEFYEESGFTHGFSVDHIIFDFFPVAKSFWDGIDEVSPGKDERYRRYQLTLNLAERFWAECQRLQVQFTPVAVIQGWSPVSMARAAHELVKMGYRYLALGGMVPLRTEAIHTAVQAVHKVLEPYRNVRLHILGFAKADELNEFKKYPLLASVDTTSPLLRAFKDKRRNYYLPTTNGEIDYYTAIRIPQALENNTLKNAVKKGLYNQEELLAMEKKALDNIRAYDRQQAELDEALEAIMAYSRPLVCGNHQLDSADQRKLDQLSLAYRKTLEDRPWRRCGCPICQKISVEVIIFRASNRNKRRGIHNLEVFYNHLQNQYGRQHG
ncbi:MAG: tRNA-guanine transglycosylase DpdA [Candidatus Competibacter sp.]|nr:tRNA-guanine transglycosylase DpdA [Candidatus Competibacter sp.]